MEPRAIVCVCGHPACTIYLYYDPDDKVYELTFHQQLSLWERIKAVFVKPSSWPGIMLERDCLEHHKLVVGLGGRLV